MPTPMPIIRTCRLCGRTGTRAYERWGISWQCRHRRACSWRTRTDRLLGLGT